MLSLSSSPAVMSPAASSGQDSLAGTACLPTFYQNHAAAQPTVTELSHLLLEKQMLSKSAKALTLKLLSVIRLSPAPAERFAPACPESHPHPAAALSCISNTFAK